MIKWPEPDDTYCGLNYYTEAQLKQAVRDFGEQCAQLVFLSGSAEQAEMRIRALIKEIPE